jgi:hypothetical protein
MIGFPCTGRASDPCPAREEYRAFFLDIGPAHQKLPFAWSDTATVRRKRHPGDGNRERYKRGLFVNRVILVLALAVLTGGCTAVGNAPQRAPTLTAPLLPEIKENAIPASINEPQKGSNTGYVDNGGFFFTIGEGVASIGDPRVDGLWIKATFLEDGKQVEVHSPSTGLSVIAEGSSSDGVLQMSLAAFQALNLSPTSLSPVEIRTP